MTNPLYTVSRCKKSSDDLYGPTHGAMNSNRTMCGLSTTRGEWWVLTNDFEGTPTCKKCLNKMQRDKK